MYMMNLHYYSKALLLTKITQYERSMYIINASTEMHKHRLYIYNLYKGKITLPIVFGAKL